LDRAVLATTPGYQQPSSFSLHLAAGTRSKLCCANVARGGRPSSGSSVEMLFIGAMSACALGMANICLEQYAKRHPRSLLGRDTNDGCNRRMCHYVVPILSMGTGLALWLVALCCWQLDGTGEDWWFGPQRQLAATWAVGLGAGHYAQEIVANQWCGTVLLLHHVAAVLHAFCLHAASSWSGLLVSWSGVYEAGSLLLSLGYIGAVSRPVGHWAATLSSVIGMCLGVHGLLVQGFCELNAAAWFSVIALVGLGIGRIQDGIDNLRTIQKQA